MAGSHRQVVGLAATAAVAVVVAGCGLQGSGAAGGVAGVLARMRPLVAHCHGPLNGYFGLDLSGSARGNAGLMAARMAQINDMADQVAACGGHIEVVGFSSSEADTATLGEAAFPSHSGTQTARLIQANRSVGELMVTITRGMASALRRVSPDGTDVLGELTLAQQFQAQSDGGTLYAELATDSVNTTDPVVMHGAAFTDPVARQAAAVVPVPDLAGATVRMVGIGVTASAGSTASLSSARITALTDFYEIACQRTRARCLITTSYTNGD